MQKLNALQSQMFGKLRVHTLQCSFQCSFTPEVRSVLP